MRSTSILYRETAVSRPWIWVATGLAVIALVALYRVASGGATFSAETVATAESLRDAARQDNRAYGILRSLLVEVGPRFAGSEGDRKAVVWARAKMEELGFERVRTEPVTVPRWERGDNQGWITAPWPQQVVLTALGGSVPTPPGGIEAPVIEVESIEALGELPEGAATGKIVFFNRLMERTRDGSGYGRAVQARGRGPAEAVKLGAVAVLIRSAGTSTGRIAHTGGTRYEEDGEKIPAAALSNADADLLAAQLEMAAEAGGQPVTFRLLLTTRQLPETQSANVIGELRGRELPEEIVLLGAHLDSWDLTPGAHDDGAGVAIVLAAAHRIAQLPQRPRRTIRVVLFANEEFGLSGARAYAEAHEAELAEHVAAVESDLGAGQVWAFTSGVPAGYRAAVEQIAGVLAPLGIEQGDNDGRGGADLIPLRPARVPQFGLWQDASLYFDVHHTLADTLDKIDPEGLSQNVAAYAAFAYMAAELPGGFGRAPEN